VDRAWERTDTPFGDVGASRTKRFCDHLRREPSGGAEFNSKIDFPAILGND
jgi:hypothetical protein